MKLTEGRSRSRTITGALAALGLLGALAMPALAASVEPEFIDISANRECDDFQGPGQTWITLKVDPNPDGAGPFEYSDGTLTVWITNAQDDKTFDWSSNIGVDAVYVKAGAGGSHLYRYDPPAEATADTGLSSPGEQGNGISHISFCYDVGDPTPTPSEEPTPSPTPDESESAATATPTPTPSQTPDASEEPAVSPSEGTLGGTPAPSPGGSLPDTAVGASSPALASILSLTLLAALAAMVYVRLARQH